MRRELLALGVLVGMVGLGLFLYDRLFNRAGAVELRVLELSGSVQRQEDGSVAQRAAVGDVLEERARIQTEDGARAVLGFGAEARVTLDASSSLQVVGTGEDGLKLELEGGSVQATVRPGNGTLDISSDERSVRAQDADFTVVREPDGIVGVRAERGEVQVSDGEQSAVLTTGQRLVGSPGAPLSEQVSQALLLQVQWPTPETRATGVTISGTTEPGAQVRVGRDGAWVTVRAGADGRFVAEAPLMEGSNPISVEARSTLGDTVSDRTTVTRDTQPPRIEVQTSVQQ